MAAMPRPVALDRDPDSVLDRRIQFSFRAVKVQCPVPRTRNVKSQAAFDGAILSPRDSGPRNNGTNGAKAIGMNRRDEIIIRRALRPQMTDLYRPIGFGRALTYLVSQWSIIVSAALFSYCSWSFLNHQTYRVLVILIYLAMACLIATRFRAISLLKHEAAHGLLDEDPKVNRWVGELVSVFDHISFSAYQTAHGRHHRHFGREDLDTDFNYEAQRKMTSLLLAFHPAVFVNYVKVGFSLGGDSLLANLGRLIFNLGLPVVALTTGSFPLYFAYLFIPYFLLYPIIQAMGDYLDHSGTRPALFLVNEGLTASSLRFLVLPRNDRFHVAHHIFPRIPSERLPECHRRLLTHPTYFAHINSLRKGPRE